MILTAFVLALPLPTVTQEGAESAPVQEAMTAEERFRQRELELLSRIEELQRELAREQRSRLAQQEEWLTYMRVLRSFQLEGVPEPPEFIAEALRPKPDPAAEAQAREEKRLLRRGNEIRIQLEALLRADGARHIDVLECGKPSNVDGRPCTGPVIARLLDGRGRMVGMLKAERMWIEPSRSARSISLVFEQGYESRGGIRTEFEGGVRRMFLGSVDPKPWIEKLPDLIDSSSLAPLLDDGLWDVVALRVRLEELFAAAARSGDARWRLVGLGGVRDGVLRDVQVVEEVGSAGSPRRVFADSARIRPSTFGQGIEVLLENGNVRRGDRVAPFLSGRYRIVLPSADVEAWRAARVPGLGAPRTGDSGFPDAGVPDDASDS